MPSTTTVSLSNNALIDGVLKGVQWTDPSITFSFPTAASQYGTYDTGELATFATATAAMQTAARTILDNYAAVSGLNFTEETTNLGDATIRIAFSDAAAQTAYAYYPTAYYQGQGGDVWFSYNQAFNGPNTYANPQLGNYAWHTMLHELGHALGLKHGQDTSGVFNPLPTAFDSTEYSVMTYRSYVGAPLSGYTNETWGFSQTLMMADIAAIQYMYGANFSGPSDQVYTWSPTTGEMFINGVGQGAPGGNRIFATVWDGGGNATYDLSNYSTDLLLDLTPGSYSVFDTTQLAHLGNGNYASGNIYNALQYNGDARSLIANGIGGTGDDTIIGNEADNTLTGNAGADTISGEGGNDTILASVNDGDDLYEGGDGTDTVSYAAVSAAVTVNLAAGSDHATGAQTGTDQLYDIENVHGGSGNDTITGNGEFNRLYGEGGNDVLNAGATPNTDWNYLYGGSGDDTYQYGTGNGLVYIGGGAEGSATGTDTVVFSDLNLSDITLGLHDYAGTGLAPDGLALRMQWNNGSGSGELRLAQQGTYIENFQFADGTVINAFKQGTANADTLVGASGNDFITTGAGADKLLGKGGTNTMIGGDGNDYYYSEGVNDVIVEAAGEGYDIVYAYGDLALQAGSEIEYIASLAAGGSTITGNEVAQRIIGAAGNDTLTGNGGADELLGKDGNDVIYGGDGIDRLYSGAGTNTLYGGADNDYYYSEGVNDVIVEAAGEGYDIVYAYGDLALQNGSEVEYIAILSDAGSTITGNEIAQKIVGKDGDDSIDGQGGNDQLVGYGGQDSMSGGTGNDYLWGGAGNDILYGGADNDKLLGQSGTNTMSGGTGNDVYYSQGVNDVINEAVGEGYDVAYAYGNLSLAAGSEVEYLAAITDSDVTLDANEFDQKILGRNGNDTINAGGGNDTILAGGGDDIIDAGTGNDRIYSGTGTNTMSGGIGDDYYYAQGTGDVIIEAAGEGYDIVYAYSDFSLNAGVEIEYISALASGGSTVDGNEFGQRIVGVGGNDTFNGDGGNDELLGGGGDDILNGGADNDKLFGGTGTNTMSGGTGDDIYYIDGTNDVVVEAAGEGYDIVNAKQDFSLGAGVEVEYIGIQTASGVSVIGNTLVQRIAGYNGDDIINGGGGADTVSGGAGADTFVLENVSGADILTVLDFSGAAGQGDKLRFDAADFSAAAGALPGTQLAAYGATPGTANPTLLYDGATGNLYYDADGNGAGAESLIIKLTGAPALTAADVELV